MIDLNAITTAEGQEMAPLALEVLGKAVREIEDGFYEDIVDILGFRPRREYLPKHITLQTVRMILWCKMEDEKMRKGLMSRNFSL